MLPARVEANACSGLSNQLKQFIGGNGSCSSGHP